MPELATTAPVETTPSAMTVTVATSCNVEAAPKPPKRSASRKPKSERVGRELDDELLPVPGDYYASARYIDRRAELGDFSGKGKPASALLVLHYLWRNTARDTGKLSAGEATGWVLTGKSRIGTIARDCALSYNAARSTLDWLWRNEWLTMREASDGQGYYWRVRMDADGHAARMALLGEEAVPADGTVEGELSAPPVPTDGTPCANEWHTPCQPMAHPLPADGTHYRDLDRDLDREHHNDAVVADEPIQDQTQDQRQAPAGPKAQDPGPSVESPAEQRAAWMAKLPGRAERDDQHVIEVGFQFLDLTPQHPRGRGNDVRRWLTPRQVQCEISLSRASISHYTRQHLEEKIREAK